MSFLDQIKTIGEKAVEGTLSGVQGYINQQLFDAPVLVKQGQAEGGNLTEEQLKEGLRPGVPTVDAQNDNLQNSIQDQGMGASVMKYAPWIIGAVAIGLAVGLFAKKRG